MDSRDRLVESTQELLWERGYGAMSPKEIQRRSGVGQGSMYHHFLGKADLAVAAVRRNAAEMQAEIAPILDGPGTATERITAYLRRERDVMRGCRLGGLTQDPEVLACPELRGPIEETLGWLRARIAQLISDGQERGEIDPDASPTFVSAAVCAALQGGYVLARAQGSPEPFHEATEGALSLLALIDRPSKLRQANRRRSTHP